MMFAIGQPSASDLIDCCFQTDSREDVMQSSAFADVIVNIADCDKWQI